MYLLHANIVALSTTEFAVWNYECYIVAYRSAEACSASWWNASFPAVGTCHAASYIVAHLVRLLCYIRCARILMETTACCHPVWPYSTLLALGFCGRRQVIPTNMTAKCRAICSHLLGCITNQTTNCAKREHYFSLLYIFVSITGLHSLCFMGTFGCAFDSGPGIQNGI